MSSTRNGGSGAETATELCTRCKCRRIVRCRRPCYIHLSASLKIPLMRDEICIRSHFEYVAVRRALRCSLFFSSNKKRRIKEEEEEDRVAIRDLPVNFFTLPPLLSRGLHWQSRSYYLEGRNRFPPFHDALRTVEILIGSSNRGIRATTVLPCPPCVFNETTDEISVIMARTILYCRWFQLQKERERESSLGHRIENVENTYNIIFLVSKSSIKLYLIM